MKRFHSAWSVAINLLAPVSNVTADVKGVAAVLDKAVKALGGEEKPSKIEAVTWRTSSERETSRPRNRRRSSWSRARSKAPLEMARPL